MGSSTSTGADTTKAVRLLNQAGVTVASIAADLRVTRATVYRWRAGTRRPNKVNFVALRELVRDLLLNATAGRALACQAQVDILQAAVDALMTPGEVAAADQLAARVRDTMAAARGEAMDAERRSVTGRVDPFAVVDRDPAMELAIGTFA
jgi:transposase-like protein